MEEKNTNWQKSVCAVVLRQGKVLLARHTYGAGKGLFITPGGYLKNGESPEQAMCRELMEETGITAKPVKLLAVRFSEQDWYAAFLAAYTRWHAPQRWGRKRPGGVDGLRRSALPARCAGPVQKTHYRCPVRWRANAY